MRSRGLVMVIDGGAETRELLSTYLDRKPFQLIDFGDQLLRLVRQRQEAR